MEQQTIEHIEKNTSALKAANRLDECDDPVALVPNGYTIKRLDYYNAQPERFRGVFTTTSIHHFVEYANEQGEVFCLVNADDMCAVSYFDLGNPEQPGHGEHRARLNLKITAPFQELLQDNGKTFSQKRFAEWLEDWREFITPMSGDDKPIDIKQAIQAVRKVTINEMKSAEHSQNTFSSAKSTMEKMDANSESNLPEKLTFTCQPYSELSIYEFQTRISLITSGSEPVFTFRIIQLETAQEKMAQEFCDTLGAGLEREEARVFIGDFKKGP